MKALVLALCLLAWPVRAENAGNAKVPQKSEEDQMLDTLETMNKSLSAVFSKLSQQLKLGVDNSGKSAESVKRSLEKLAQDLQKQQNAQQGGQKGSRPPAADQGTLKALQGFIEGVSKNLLENVNDTVKKLNKMSEEMDNP